jgi:LPS-assembly lipoprotein
VIGRTTGVAGRRRWVWLCLAAALPAGLTGCGFQPVYMPTASNKPGVAQRELASVYVPIIPERPGQLLRQALQERLGDDSGPASAYDLQVRFSIAGEGIAIEADTIATRLRLIGVATWTLVAHDATHTTLTTGSARAMDGVNIFDEQYFAADLETEKVQQRMAETIAQQITTQLAIWFRKSTPRTASTATPAPATPAPTQPQRFGSAVPP